MERSSCFFEETRLQLISGGKNVDRIVMIVLSLSSLRSLLFISYLLLVVPRFTVFIYIYTYTLVLAHL